MTRQGLNLYIRRMPGSRWLARMLALLLVLLPTLTTPMSAAMAHGRMIPAASAAPADPAAPHVEALPDDHDCLHHSDGDADRHATSGLMDGCFACPACPACPFAVPLALPDLPPAPPARDFAHRPWPQPPALVPSPPLEPPRA